jgi:hypothetical protein
VPWWTCGAQRVGLPDLDPSPRGAWRARHRRSPRAIGARLRAAHASFVAAEPFPHVVLDALSPRTVADALAAEIDDPAPPGSRCTVNGASWWPQRPAPHGADAAAVVRTLQASALLRDLEVDGRRRPARRPDLDGASLHRMGPAALPQRARRRALHGKRRTGAGRRPDPVLEPRLEDAYQGWLEL